MTNQEPVTAIAENLRLGIEAARANQFDQARAYLVKVLQQDSHNLPAMFWLAFVAPSPQESISLLNRVLSLDPDNDRARAGIRWAERRLAAASTQLPDEESEAQTELPDELTRQQLLSNDEVHQRAKKSALAHRARRTIDPLLIMIIIVAAASLLTLGVLALAFGPPETLAAWLPVTVEIEASPDSFQETIAPAAINQALLSSKNVSSKADTIIAKPAQLAGQTRLVTVKPLNMLPASEPASVIELDQAVLDNEGSSLPVESVGPIEQRDDGLQLFQPAPDAMLAHQPVSPDEKWIEVDVTKQQVTAWEGNVPVMFFTASTGLPNTPTVLGKFNIYWKLQATLMTGPGYYLPEVPHTMYFYSGYALHGAYWHNNFGQPMSHGCVNLSIDDSKKLFEWADPVILPGQSQVVASADNPGTLVVVHD